MNKVFPKVDVEVVLQGGKNKKIEKLKRASKVSSLVTSVAEMRIQQFYDGSRYQLDDGSRLIGLWLWDQRELLGRKKRTFSKVSLIQEMVKEDWYRCTKVGAEYLDQYRLLDDPEPCEEVIRKHREDLRVAEACIESRGKILSYTDAR